MFERLTRWPTDLSEPEIYEAANGMHVIHQDDLMNDTAPLFTKWLENTAIKMPEEIAAKLVSKLYPPQCNSPLALPTTLNLPPYLLQPLRLQQQEVERCNKLRAVHSAK
jgi:hypothetical protein